jgi:class 3 adenylate cyclase
VESLSLNVNKNNQPATVVTKKKMSVKRSKTQFSESSSIESMVSESKISKLLSESLTKKVIVLILSMLIFLPVLQEDFYSNDSNNDYTILAKYIDNYWAIGGKDSFNFTDPQNPGGFYMHSIENSVDPNFPILIIKINNILWYRNSSWGEYPFRSSETRNSLSADGIVQITYSVMSDTSLSGILNMVRTIFVCVCLTTAAIYFEADARELVLQPLEIMIEIVDYVAKDPINAKNVENLNKGVKSTIQKIGKKNKNSKKEQLTEEKYEIKVIESAIIKISALLAIGFGDAGGEIIKENLSSSSELNPMLKGKKKVAIFGFCDIRNFPTVNEALQEDTMLFVNEIAEIVHSSVDRFAGAANKNIGDAFLMVWKFPPEDEIFIKKESLELDPECRAVQQTADMAVLGFLDVIIRINSDQRVLKYRSNNKIEQVLKQYQVKMGFGLHLGWAIEGAIGSSYKIDASYLSPNVNMAARLEAATRIYGVNILVSGPLFDKLSDEMKDICRLIDIVTVKGSIEPMRLYTIDLNINLTPEDPNRVFKELTEKEQRLLYKNKRDKILNEGKVCGSVPLYVLKKKRYVELLNTGRKSKFYDEWEEGFSNYIDGKWEEAAKHFNNCLSMVTSDGPCTTLLGYLKAHNYTAPAKWKGVRELTSKT